MTKKTFKSLVIASFWVALLIAFVVFIAVGQSEQEQVAKEQAAQVAKAEKIALIKKQIKTSLSSKDYQSVVSSSSKYLAAGDAELNKLHSEAKEILDKIQKDKRTKELLAKLKKTPPTKEFEKNKNLYSQLVTLHPDNKKYKGKVDFYSKRIEKQKKIKLAAEARAKKIKSQFSLWDGSHYQLEKLIKRGMNDPNSYEHVETVYWDQNTYIVVQTTFRGRNAFGGMVRNFVKAKVSLVDGQILQILDQT